MKTILSILFNALILYLMTYLLWASPEKSIEAWITVSWWIKTYLLWWLVLWIMNVTVKPILKLLSLPLYLLFLWLIVFISNWALLWLFTYTINHILVIPWIEYSINWTINFIIAVAIFSILNMFYALLFSKK
jgi:uncharacterized membrane protein YvlD (DUF360 family)